MPIKLKTKQSPKRKNALFFLQYEEKGKDGVFSVNLSTKEELHLFSQVLQKYLSPMEVEQLARASKFVRRTSKYRGQGLVTLCVQLSHNLASTSLTQLCSELEAATGINMSAEGLNQRLNEHAVTFLQQLFDRLLKAELGSASAISSEYRDLFLRIGILDSTTFQVPDSLAELYPGAGGCGHTAGVKIQLEYDLHSGQFLNLVVGAGKKTTKPLVLLVYPPFDQGTCVYET